MYHMSTEATRRNQNMPTSTYITELALYALPGMLKTRFNPQGSNEGIVLYGRMQLPISRSKKLKSINQHL